MSSIITTTTTNNNNTSSVIDQSNHLPPRLITKSNTIGPSTAVFTTRHAVEEGFDFRIVLKDDNDKVSNTHPHDIEVERQFECHKAVLINASPYFADHVLLQNDASKSIDSATITNCHPKALEFVLGVMYTADSIPAFSDDVNDDQDYFILTHAHDLMYLAVLFRLPHLESGLLQKLDSIELSRQQNFTSAIRQSSNSFVQRSAADLLEMGTTGSSAETDGRTILSQQEVNKSQCALGQRSMSPSHHNITSREQRSDNASNWKRLWISAESDPICGMNSNFNEKQNNTDRIDSSSSVIVSAQLNSNAETAAAQSNSLSLLSIDGGTKMNSNNNSQLTTFTSMRRRMMNDGGGEMRAWDPKPKNSNPTLLQYGTLLPVIPESEIDMTQPQMLRLPTFNADNLKIDEEAQVLQPAAPQNDDHLIRQKLLQQIQYAAAASEDRRSFNNNAVRSMKEEAEAAEMGGGPSGVIIRPKPIFRKPEMPSSFPAVSYPPLQASNTTLTANAELNNLHVAMSTSVKPPIIRLKTEDEANDEIPPRLISATELLIGKEQPKMVNNPPATAINQQHSQEQQQPQQQPQSSQAMLEYALLVQHFTNEILKNQKLAEAGEAKNNHLLPCSGGSVSPSDGSSSDSSSQGSSMGQHRSTHHHSSLLLTTTNPDIQVLEPNPLKRKLSFSSEFEMEANNEVKNPLARAGDGISSDNQKCVKSHEDEGWCRNKKYIKTIPEGFECLVCHKTFGRYNSVSYHVTMYHRNPPITCGQADCDFTTRESRYIHFHRYYRHGIPLPPRIDTSSRGCSFCGLVAKSPTMLAKHMVKHEALIQQDTVGGMGRFRCPECPVQMETAKLVLRHIVKVHAKPASALMGLNKTTTPVSKPPPASLEEGKDGVHVNGFVPKLQINGICAAETLLHQPLSSGGHRSPLFPSTAATTARKTSSASKWGVIEGINLQQQTVGLLPTSSGASLVKNEGGRGVSSATGLRGSLGSGAQCLPSLRFRNSDPGITTTTTTTTTFGRSDQVSQNSPQQQQIEHSVSPTFSSSSHRSSFDTDTSISSSSSSINSMELIHQQRQQLQLQQHFLIQEQQQGATMAGAAQQRYLTQISHQHQPTRPSTMSQANALMAHTNQSLMAQQRFDFARQVLNKRIKLESAGVA